MNRSGICTGAPAPAGLAAEEKTAYDELVFLYYALYMGSRQRTLTGLADSPLALANFMIDFDATGLERLNGSRTMQKEPASSDTTFPRKRYALSRKPFLDVAAQV